MGGNFPSMGGGVLASGGGAKGDIHHSSGAIGSRGDTSFGRPSAM